MSFISILGQIAKAAIPFIIELGQKLLSKIGETPSLDKNTSVADVEQISSALHDLRAEVLDRSQATLDNANDAIKFYIEEQLFNLEERAELLAKYEISSRSVERRMQNIHQSLNKFWTDSLSRRISLDDERCRSILMLPSGAKKSADLEKFINDVLNETLDEYADRVREELADLYVELEDDVNRSLKRVERSVEQYDRLVQSLDDKDDDRFEQLIANAKIKIACCDAVIGKAGA